MESISRWGWGYLDGGLNRKMLYELIVFILKALYFDNRIWLILPMGRGSVKDLV